jgi:hypothetical protein
VRWRYEPVIDVVAAPRSHPRSSVTAATWTLAGLLPARSLDADRRISSGRDQHPGAPAPRCCDLSDCPCHRAQIPPRTRDHWLTPVLDVRGAHAVGVLSSFTSRPADSDWCRTPPARGTDCRPRPTPVRRRATSRAGPGAARCGRRSRRGPPPPPLADPPPIRGTGGHARPGSRSQAPTLHPGSPSESETPRSRGRTSAGRTASGPQAGGPSRPSDDLRTQPVRVDLRRCPCTGGRLPHDELAHHGGRFLWP